MNRRAFLRAMIAAGVGATIDPERLLWVPRQMVSVPAMPRVQIRIKKMMARIVMTEEALLASGEGAFVRACREERALNLRDLANDVDREFMLLGARGLTV